MRKKTSTILQHYFDQVRYVLIKGTTSTILNSGISKMEQFLNNVEGRVEIFYHDNVSSQEVGDIERKMQDLCNRLQNTVKICFCFINLY